MASHPQQPAFTPTSQMATHPPATPPPAPYLEARIGYDTGNLAYYVAKADEQAENDGIAVSGYPRHGPEARGGAAGCLVDWNGQVVPPTAYREAMEDVGRIPG
ncbi:hypothetical protein CC1G_08266 [Coprinopsis cinerea okayama7|uniref:Uncharacterized protein n=1 Tax=Coprinopsis cinerea (strain Okayama-7 / 130 / ATCC MYA-4618 / FGSC 9003) TaxID=240176 RepID=A8PG20_COPC7|nr:hypothetical protein CC1G_08266 [Coprinopsis cinerea okayama7\|eukprot:XP_001841122.2 hypothetical protein CC1G_08266 [Coprinopsis cinerea okayama7\